MLNEVKHLLSTFFVPLRMTASLPVVYTQSRPVHYIVWGTGHRSCSMEKAVVPTDLLGQGRKLKAEEKIFVASRWRLMWLHFRRHKVAMIGMGVVGFMYLVSLFAPFIAPYDKMTRFGVNAYMPPMAIHFYDGETHSL